MTNTPKPTEISLHQKSRILEIAFEDGARFEVPYEFLRVHSPSAEVQGHGPGQGVLQIGKQDVTGDVLFGRVLPDNLRLREVALRERVVGW